MVTAIRDLVGGRRAIRWPCGGPWRTPLPDDSGDELDGGTRRCILRHRRRQCAARRRDSELFSARAAVCGCAFISDSCHFGLGDRGSEGPRSGMPRARFLPPEAWMPGSSRSLLARPLGLFGLPVPATCCWRMPRHRIQLGYPFRRTTQQRPLPTRAPSSRPCRGRQLCAMVQNHSRLPYAVLKLQGSRLFKTRSSRSFQGLSCNRYQTKPANSHKISQKEDLAGQRARQG